MRAERKAPEDGRRQPDSDSAPSPGWARGRRRPLTGGPHATVKERERDDGLGRERKRNGPAERFGPRERRKGEWANCGKKEKEKDSWAGWAEKKEGRRKGFPFSKLIQTLSN